MHTLPTHSPPPPTHTHTFHTHTYTPIHTLCFVVCVFQASRATVLHQYSVSRGADPCLLPDDGAGQGAQHPRPHHDVLPPHEWNILPLPVHQCLCPDGLHLSCHSQVSLTWCVCVCVCGGGLLCGVCIFCVCVCLYMD